MLDHPRHVVVRRGEGDLAAGRPNHDKAQGIYGIPILVEALDRMSAKTGRDGGVARQEFAAIVRIIGNKGIDELQCRYFLLALGLLEPPQAEMVDAKSDGNREECAKAQVSDKPGAGL